MKRAVILFPPVLFSIALSRAVDFVGRPCGVYPERSRRVGAGIFAAHTATLLDDAGGSKSIPYFDAPIFLKFDSDKKIKKAGARGTPAFRQETT